MRRANRRAVCGFLFTTLVMLLASGGVAAQICPDNFFGILENSADMTAAKQDIGTLCIGHEVTFRSTLLDIARRGDQFELHLASLSTGNRITVMMRDAPATDTSHLQKGSTVTISAKLRSFTGVQSEYVTFDDGRCVDCSH